ncbi:MAG: DUF362 domain-containing protein [Nitrospirae bacterium]|nr:DUF362 domain-containing protein [Nitrospirota bacterium]
MTDSGYSTDKNRGLTRRHFLADTVLAPLALGVTSLLYSCGGRRLTPPERSRVVRVTRPDATDQSGGKDNVNLDGEAVRAMVDSGIRSLTNKETTEAAWEAIIPDPDKKVAIKVNCQITGIYTKAKVVSAVTEGLIARGVSPSNIIIYDLTDNAFAHAGFEKNTGEGIKVGTCDELGGFSWTTWFKAPIPLVGNKFCKVIAGEGAYGCDYLINMPVLKALDGYSGVSISMKNHFGSISSPARLHATIQDSIALLNTHDVIVKKTRLILVDGIFTEYKWFNGRDQETVDVTNQLLFGTDPVAVDFVGWQMIEDLRKRHGLEPLDPKPVFIQKAALEYGLGNADVRKIDLVDI